MAKATDTVRSRARGKIVNRAGIYVRVSVDRDGASESPQRQVEDCRALADRHGLEVAQVYEDRDQSAYSKHARRPAYRKMLADLKTGEINTVVCWKLDRLTRQGVSGFTEIYEAVEKAGGVLLSVNENLDTSTPMGRGVAGILASVAEQESVNTSTRVKRANRAAAEAGKPHGGLRGYGYEQDGSIVPEEAAIIREAVGRVLGGESFHSIAVDLNERGVTTSTGGRRWYSNRLALILRSPRIAGFRTHGDETYPGAWEPIITVDEHRQLVDTKVAPRSHRMKQNLLAGIVRCGRCGGPMKVHSMNRSYTCVPSAGSSNCGRVGISRSSLEKHVVDVLFGLLSAGKLLPGEDGKSAGKTDLELRRLVEDDNSALVELSRARFKDRTMGQAEYVELRAEIEERVASVEEELERRADLLRRAEAAPGLRPGSREDLDTWWTDHESERFDAVHAYVDCVTIQPHTPPHRGNFFDKGRVHVQLNWPALAHIAGVVGESMTDDERDRAEEEARSIEAAEADAEAS